jgi:hypothetical protein
MEKRKMAKNDRWSKEQSSASSSYLTLPMWMLQIEKKGRATTTFNRETSQVEETTNENRKQSTDFQLKAIE